MISKLRCFLTTISAPRRATAITAALLFFTLLAPGKASLADPAPFIAQEISVRVQTPAYQLDVTGLHVPDYALHTTPGAPQLAVWTEVIELPLQGDWEIDYDLGDSKILQTPVILPPVAGPVVSPPEPGGGMGDPDNVSLVAVVAQPDPAIYQKDAFYPDQPVQPGAVQIQRGRRLLPLRVFPFQYNPLTAKLRYYPDIHITVRVIPGEPASDQSVPADSDKQKVTFARSLLTGAGSLRIRTGERGVYQITGQHLQDAGVILTDVDPATFAMTYLGQSISIEVMDGGDGDFGITDKVIFYALPYRGRYQDYNTYWLIYGGTPGPRISERAVTPTGSEPVVNEIWRTVHVEKNKDYRSAYPLPQDADHWFDTQLYTHAAAPQASVTYDLPLIDPLTTGSATLRATLHGGVNQGADPDQSMAFRLNGHDIGMSQWDGSTYHTATASFNASLLDPDTNQVELEAALSQLPGLSYYWVSPDWVELTYPALASTNVDRLYIEAMASGQNEVVATGFSSGDTNEIIILDVRDPFQPVELTTKSAQADGEGGYALSFWDQALPDPSYFLSTESAFLNPLLVELDASSNWHSPSHAYDYIAIVHSSLWDAIDPLLAHRSAPVEDLRVAKVDVQDVYDEFNFGLIDPEAIRDFLTYAYNNWNAGEDPPTYVLLVGDGHYDFNNYFGSGLPNLIPPYLVDVDPWIGEVPADNRYVSIDGPDDYMADMHIGRIPAQTPQEVMDVVDKIIAYETTAPDGDWQRRAVFVAGSNSDGSGDFHAFSDRIRLNPDLLPPAYDGRHVYLNLDFTTSPEGIASTKEAFNNGTVLLQWFGHASRFRWGDTMVFANYMVSELDSNTTWPFTMHFSCWSGYFVNLHKLSSYSYMDETVGEALLLTPQRGSIADLSPAGLHIGAALTVLNEGIYRALFQDEIKRVGAVVDAGKQFFFVNSAAWHDVIDTSILLGDPALRLRTTDSIATPTPVPISIEYLPVMLKDAKILWTHEEENETYQVWRDTQPYFHPDAAEGNQIAVILGADYGQGDQIEYIDDGIDDYPPAAPDHPPVIPVGDVNNNYFYLVRSVNIGENPADSLNRVGIIDFALTSGE